MTSAVLLSHGARVRVDAPDGILKTIVERTARFAEVTTDTTADTTVTVSVATPSRWAITSETGGRTTTEGPGSVVADHAIDHMHHLFAAFARDVLFVHAGVFELDGELVVVPGRSRSGKSSLVATAVAHGAVYYSDEFAIVDADGLVHPYLRPMSLRRPGQSNVLVTVNDDVDQVATGPAAPCIVLSTRFREGATWSPEVVTGSRAALPIIDNTVRARFAPSETTRMAAEIARRAVTLVGDRGEATDLLLALEARRQEGSSHV